MKKSSLLLITVLFLSLALTACGAGNAPTTDLKVEFTDFAFNPDTFVIPAGQEITLEAKNAGAVVHEFVIMKLGTTVGEDFGDEDEGNIYWEVEVEPGDAPALAAWVGGLHAQPWLSNVTLTNGGSVARLVVKDVTAARRELLPLALGAGLALRRYEIVTPSLEDIFLRLVGQEEQA